MFTILGAGLSGLAVADHLQKRGLPYQLFEAKNHGGGHVYSEVVDGFTWDEGPHVSFTKHQYVKEYFENNCWNEFLEYPTKPVNYYKGDWIAHPAQSNLYAVQEPLRTRCVEDAIIGRNETAPDEENANYQDWITYAFGKTFSETFAKVYTEKYWTTSPEQLTTDWIGKRIYFPELADMVESAKGPLPKQTHYISKVRYPLFGGYYSYIKNIEEQVSVNYNKELIEISFEKRQIKFSDGEQIKFEKLISTLPLPMLISKSDAPLEIKEAASQLKCSQVLIVNVVVNHPAPVENHWIYVYDKDFYSTRINFTDLLSPNNGEPGKCGIQVEVYFSDYHMLNERVEDIAEKVLDELVVMGLIAGRPAVKSYHTKWISWANVIFDTRRKTAQNTVFEWLTTFGLKREADDLEPMTDWITAQPATFGDIIFAGRFAQWKYFWTDDCVMRGKFIAENITNG